jgi:iron complex transport system ATP-binding protein
MTLLVARDISVESRGTRRLAAVSCSLEPGRSIGVIGPNGAGKSTLLRALVGVEPLVEGSVEVAGHDVHRLRRRDVARRIAWMAPTWSTPFALKGLDAVLLGRTAWLGPLGVPTAEDRARAMAQLCALGVEHLADRPITRMSSGERQRVQLAAVLLQNAPVLLLDEPTSAQDLDGVRRVFATIEARTREGSAVIAAVHDLTEAARRFDELIVLHAGRLIARGAPHDVLERPEVRAAWSDAWTTVTVDGDLIVRARRS